MKVLFAAALALTSADAATRVAVIELGKSGTVRKTTSAREETSVEGVASFWSALHGYGRKLQHAGMPVVPDLFSRPDSGVVVGLTGVDLDSMPNLNKVMSEDAAAVGHMEVEGQHCKGMMNKLNVEKVESTNLYTSFESQANEAGISGMQMQVTNENASDVDMQMVNLLEKAGEEASNSGRTVVLHLVVEEDEGSSRRRRLARRLQEDEEEEGNEENGEGDENEENNNQQRNNLFYGYGYYNAYGEWVTPYKTMFQIQYFNVVLWTSVGLVMILFFALYLMVYMPLMADTLLFGQSAQMVNND